MKSTLFFLFISAVFITHSLGATQSTNIKRYWTLDKEAQEKVKDKAKELIQEYDAKQHPIDVMKAQKEYFAAQIQKLETLLQQCKEGTIAPQLAPGCETENNYTRVHAFKLLLKHIEQKIMAEEAKS